VLAILSESPEAAAWSQESLLQLASADPTAWIAEMNGGVAGFLIGRIAGDEFEILNMAVSRALPPERDRSNLLESALEFSRIAGARGFIWRCGPRIERPSHCTAPRIHRVGRRQSITATPSRTAYCFLYAWEKRPMNFSEWPTIGRHRFNSVKI